MLIALDLDGTVISSKDPKAPPSRLTVETLAALAGKHTVAVVTARAPWDSAESIRALGLGPGPHVFIEGALVTGRSGEVAHRTTIRAAEVIGAYAGTTPGATFSLDPSGDGWLTCENHPQTYNTTWLGRASHEALGAVSTTTIGVRVPCDGAYGPNDLCTHAEAAYARAALDPEVYRAHIGRRGWASIIAAGTDKATGLARLAEMLGVPQREVVAFGDSRNDVPMLGWAGHGVAMGQAPEEVKAAADEVAPGCDEDGVARVLRGMFGV